MTRRRVTGLAACALTAMMLTGCAASDERPDPFVGPYVPEISPSAQVDRGALSPDGFTQAQRMTVRVRNIGCQGLSTGTGFAIDAPPFSEAHSLVMTKSRIPFRVLNLQVQRVRHA